jgi:hypothetical protein
MADCSLGPEERRERGDEISRLAAQALVGRSRRGRTVQLEYRASEALEASLRDLIRRERECCPFLDFELRGGQGTLTLEVSGPPGASAVLAGIYERSARP